MGSRRNTALLILVVLLGVGLRLHRIGAQSVWYDEAFSVAHSSRPLPELFAILIDDFVHPPLHYLVLHAWFKTAGFGAIQARLVSVLFGSLSILLLYILARRVTDSRTSLVAALLLSISQMAVYFSQEARPYAQAQFLSLATALAFLQFMHRPSVLASAFLVATSGALLYTHYYGLGTLLALTLYLLVFRPDNIAVVLRRLLVVVALLVAVFAPWAISLASTAADRPARLLSLDRHSSARPSWSAPLGALNRFNNGKFVSVEDQTTGSHSIAGVILFTLPVVMGLWFASKDQLSGIVLGCMLAAVPVGMAVLMGAAGMVFNYRHYSFAVPGYCLAVAIGSSTFFWNSRVRLTWLVLALGYSAVALRANYAVTKPDYRVGFRALAENYQPGDCVAGRPRVWDNKLHLAWEVYYQVPKITLLVPFDALTDAHQNCHRIWIYWDKTWWMNLKENDTRASRQALAQLGGQFHLVKLFQHPAVELQLWKRL